MFVWFPSFLSNIPGNITRSGACEIKAGESKW